MVASDHRGRSQDWSDIGPPSTIQRVFKLDSEVLPSPDPLAIALPTYDVDLMIATKRAVESQSLGPVQKMGKAVELIVVASAWNGLKLPFGCCQTNSNQSQFATKTTNLSGTKLTPLGKNDAAYQLEGISAGERSFLVEVVVDRGMDGREFLQTSH